MSIASYDPDSAHLLTVEIFHSTSSNTNDWTQRGTVTLNFNPKSTTQGKAIVFSNQQEIATKALKELVHTNGLYRVKFVPEGTKQENGIITAVQAVRMNPNNNNAA